MLTFDLFMARSNLLPHAFEWALYINMGKMLWIHILDISVIQLNWNLMSIRAPNRHKIAAAILKISFQHLFPDLWSLWTEPCSVATGWLLDRNKLKFCWLEFQDGQNGSTPLNKNAARATDRKSLNDIHGQWLDFKIFDRSVPPMAPYQNC